MAHTGRRPRAPACLFLYSNKGYFSGFDPAAARLEKYADEAQYQGEDEQDGDRLLHPFLMPGHKRRRKTPPAKLMSDQLINAAGRPSWRCSGVYLVKIQACPVYRHQIP